MQHCAKVWGQRQICGFGNNIMTVQNNISVFFQNTTRKYKWYMIILTLHYTGILYTLSPDYVQRPLCEFKRFDFAWRCNLVLKTNISCISWIQIMNAKLNHPSQSDRKPDLNPSCIKHSIYSAILLFCYITRTVFQILKALFLSPYYKTNLWCYTFLSLCVSELESGAERAHHIQQIVVTLPRTIIIVMRYLFAFLNQWVSLTLTVAF